MEDVGRFIEKFQNPDNNRIFTGDCSYWFAVIVHRRFIRNGSKIMFDSETNHFGAMVDGRVYDITGDVTEKYKWIPWIKLQDNLVKEKVTN